MSQRHVIDDAGRLFGWINIIDFIVLVGFLILLGGGVSLVTSETKATPSPAQPPSENATVVVASLGNQYEIQAVRAATPNPQQPANQVWNVTVTDSLSTNASKSTAYTSSLYRFEATIVLQATKKDGLLYYRNKRLVVGRNMRIDLNRTIVDGTVIKLRP